MTKKHKNMALSHILDITARNPLRLPEALFSGGIPCDFSFLPDNILVWKSASDLTVTSTSIHQRMILKIILSGEVITVVDDIRIPMKAGDMILFFPFQFHSTRLLCRPAEYSFLAITFTEKNKNYSAMLSLKNRVLTPDRRDAADIGGVIRGYLHPDRCPPEKAVISLLKVLLNQRRKIQDAERKDVILPQERFDRICEYLRNNFSRDISLKTVAAEFQVSEETIRRMFHKAYAEITPGKLIRRLRMQMAVELLEHSNEPVAGIARKCGYADAFVFSRAFKRTTGISPLNHRKNHFAGRNRIS